MRSMLIYSMMHWRIPCALIKFKGWDRMHANMSNQCTEERKANNTIEACEFLQVIFMLECSKQTGSQPASPPAQFCTTVIGDILGFRTGTQVS